MRLGKFYGHKGDIWGSSGVLFYLPAKDATVVVNVNRMEQEDIDKNYADNVFFAVSRILYPKHVNW